MCRALLICRNFPHHYYSSIYILIKERTEPGVLRGLCSWCVRRHIARGARFIDTVVRYRCVDANMFLVLRKGDENQYLLGML